MIFKVFVNVLLLSFASGVAGTADSVDPPVPDSEIQRTEKIIEELENMRKSDFGSGRTHTTHLRGTKIMLVDFPCQDECKRIVDKITSASSVEISLEKDFALSMDYWKSYLVQDILMELGYNYSDDAEEFTGEKGRKWEFFKDTIRRRKYLHYRHNIEKDRFDYAAKIILVKHQGADKNLRYLVLYYGQN